MQLTLWADFYYKISVLFEIVNQPSIYPNNTRDVYLYTVFIVANIKILGIMLINQMIKGCKEKFFINQIFDENIRRLHQGKKFFGKKMLFFCRKTFFPDEDV